MNQKTEIIGNFKDTCEALLKKDWNLNDISKKTGLSWSVLMKVRDNNPEEYGDMVHKTTLMKMSNLTLQHNTTGVRKPRKGKYSKKTNHEFNTEIPEDMLDAIPEECIEKKVDGEQLEIPVEKPVVDEPMQPDAEYVVTREHYDREIRTYVFTGTLQDVLDDLIRKYDDEGWVLKVKITHKDLVE